MAANSNVLVGVECPSCGSGGPFDVTGSATFRVTDEGSEVVGDHEWDEASDCRCVECGYRKAFGEFKAAEEGDA